MTVARVLPAELAARFAGAERAVCTAESASFELVVAGSFTLRLRGLAWLDASAIVPLLFPRCRSLHTFGMRAPIDVVWLDLVHEGEGGILGVDPAVAPGRIIRAPHGGLRRRIAALELPAGDADVFALRPGGPVTVARAPG